MLNDCKIQPPDSSWTWDDFIDIAGVCQEYGLSVFSDWRPITTPPFLTNYINTFVNPIQGVSEFDNQTFFHLCDIWNRCLAERLITEEGYLQESLFSEISITAMSSFDPQYPIILPPKLGADVPRVIDAELGLIGLNVYGEHKDMAAAFLQIYFSKDLAPLSNLVMFKDMALYPSEDMGQPFAHTWQLFRPALAAASPRDEVTSIRITASSELYDHFANDKALETTIKNIESTVDMILNE